MRLTRRFLVAGATSLLLAGTMVVSAGAAALPTAPGQNKLQCFSGTTDVSIYGGTCTLFGNGAKGPAILSNSDGNPNGDYAGVYIANSTLTNAPLGSITQLGYTYVGNIAPTPTDLSLNIPISSTGSGVTDYGYAFIDAYYCPGVFGVVDVINDPTCGIWYFGTNTSDYFANWTAFVAAYPSATVANDNLPFIIAERTPGTPAQLWTISNVVLGKPGK